MRKLKLFHILLVIICSFCFVVIAQENKISSDDLLKLRSLQYEQAKRVIRLQDLRNEFIRVSSENESISAEIESWIKEQAKKQNIDLTKNHFDSDQLKFVETKKNE